jgi:hypothetical protein
MRVLSLRVWPLALTFSRCNLLSQYPKQNKYDQNYNYCI